MTQARRELVMTMTRFRCRNATTEETTAAVGPHLLRQLSDAAHHRPLTYALAHALPPKRAAGASGSLRAETRAQRVEYVLGRAGDVVDLAIDQAHRGRAGRLPGDADDGGRTQPDVPVIGLELDEVTHDRPPLSGPARHPFRRHSSAGWRFQRKRVRG